MFAIERDGMMMCLNACAIFEIDTEITLSDPTSKSLREKERVGEFSFAAVKKLKS